MSARSGLVGKKSSWPHLGPSEAIFSIGRKNRKNAKILPIFLGGPMGPIHPVWGSGGVAEGCTDGRKNKRADGRADKT